MRWIVTLARDGIRLSVMAVRRVLHPRSDRGDPARAEVFVDGPAVVTSVREYTSDVEVGFVVTDGVERSGPSANWWAEPFELVSPA
ncbi:hypothetical protein [Streptomyces sp. NPDC014623]|uniref:hypothetical protein n=1 Tax=Streptomyces sp. NPDC014623 TaxID=3364875 RepID=UPI0036FD8179